MTGSNQKIEIVRPVESSGIDIEKFNQSDVTVLDSEYFKGVVSRALVFETLFKTNPRTDCAPVLEVN